MAEEKVATTEEVAKEEETPKESSETTTEETDKESEVANIDYKQELEEERKRRMKAEAIIQRHKPKKEEEVEEEETPDDEPLTAKSVAEVVERTVSKHLGALSVNMQRRQLEDEVARVAETPDERELILHHLENTVRLTGDVRLDVENAKAIANRRRLASKLEEAKMAALSKHTRQTVTGGAGQKPSAQADVKLSAIDQAAVNRIRALGYVINNNALARIMKGEDVSALIDQGVIKKKT